MEENGTISDARISDAGSFAWITIDVPVTVGANLEGTDAERFALRLLLPGTILPSAASCAESLILLQASEALQE